MANPGKSTRERGRARKKAMLDSVKMAWGCPCGYAAIPEALHFHHRDPDSKYRWPGRSRSLYNLGMSSLLAEIAKCDVLCANCHAEVTHG